MADELLLTVSEAAQRKGVAASAIYKAVSEGRIPARKVLGRTALTVADVDAYEPGSYGGTQRATKRRGPGRPKPAHGIERNEVSSGAVAEQEA